MDTQLVTQNIRLVQWNNMFQAKIQSGLTTDEFCERNGISRNKYYYWLRKCKEAALQHCSDAFVEVIPPAPALEVEAASDRFIPEALIDVNGMNIAVTRQTSKELLTMLIEVLRNA